MSELITHPKFATAERLAALRDQGIVVIDETRDWGDLELKEPQYGEEYLGDLQDDEKALFMALYDAQRELEDKTRTMMGNQISKVGERIRDSDRSKSIQEAVQEAEMSFDNDDDAVAFFRLEKMKNMLHATFHYGVAERLNAHQYVLGVRTQGRIYKVERRY
jgi:hypothetical protein